MALNTEYDIEKAFRAIEDELIASMIRNLDRHRAEEDELGFNWTQWQVEQLKALEKYKADNKTRFAGRFSDINSSIPLLFYKSAKYKGRGKSIFDAKIDNFDALDEAWSQWMDALRRNRTKEYIPENMLPRNPLDGKVLKPNAFDNAYIKTDGSMAEGTVNKIELVQGNIPHESYLATYITALDLCLQGIMSPSTLGIDVKKLDNADAQREKEKATLYSRNNIVERLQKVLPKLVTATFNAIDTLNKTAIKDIDIDVTFGEYANPSFESQVETVSKAKQGGIMSIEASVDELYGDTKDDEWKQEEIARIKAEQGISDMEEPALNMQADGFTVNGTDNSFTGFDNK
mgnify:CR=1 FL=1